MASLQDTQTIHGSSRGGSISGSLITGTPTGASANAGETSGDKAWVANVTSLNGSDSISVHVGGTTTLTGAIISNVDANGIDQGNLELTTQNLVLSDIKDIDTYDATTAGVGIGNGDALSGAVGAGAAEAARPATKDADDATQQTVSAVVGAIAGGGTGASTGLDGEKYNRQLHQREIAWIKEHAEEFAQELYGENPTPEQLADAKARLAQQALRGVDKGWSLKLGSKDDESAKAFLDQNNAHLFTVKNAYEFKDGSTDGEHEISSLDQEAFGTLASFYQTNITRATSSNPDGTLRNANEAWANEKDMIDALKEGEIGLDEFNQALRDFIPNAAESITQIPDAAHSSGNYLDAVLPTTNQERLDILYGSHTDGSVLQANLSTADAISTMGMATGAGMAAHGIVRAGGRALNGAVDEALDVNLQRPSINDNAFDPRPISREEAQKLLEERYIKQGETPETAKRWAETTVDSFEGQITTRMVLDGDRLLITHGTKSKNPSDNSASGLYTTRKSAGKTPRTRQEVLALPKSNTADVERGVTITEPHEVLEGKVKGQAEQKWAHDHATGGGQQTVIDPSKIIIDINIKGNN